LIFSSVKKCSKQCQENAAKKKLIQLFAHSVMLSLKTHPF